MVYNKCDLTRVDNAVCKSVVRWVKCERCTSEGLDTYSTRFDTSGIRHYHNRLLSVVFALELWTSLSRFGPKDVTSSIYRALFINMPSPDCVCPTVAHCKSWPSFCVCCKRIWGVRGGGQHSCGRVRGRMRVESCLPPLLSVSQEGRASWTANEHRSNCPPVLWSQRLSREDCGMGWGNSASPSAVLRIWNPPVLPYCYSHYRWNGSDCYCMQISKSGSFLAMTLRLRGCFRLSWNSRVKGKAWKPLLCFYLFTESTLALD